MLPVRAKDMDLTFDDVLMYALERGMYNVVKYCFSKTSNNPITLSQSCQSLLVMTSMPVAALKIGSPLHFLNGHLLLECSKLLRSLKFINSKCSSLGGSKLFAFSAIKLQKAIFMHGLCCESSSSVILERLDKSFGIDAYQSLVFGQNARLTAMVKKELSAFHYLMTKLIKNDEARRSYIDRKMWLDFSDAFWSSLHDNICAYINTVKYSLPISEVEEKIARCVKCSPTGNQPSEGDISNIIDSLTARSSSGRQTDVQGSTAIVTSSPRSRDDHQREAKEFDSSSSDESRGYGTDIQCADATMEESEVLELLANHGKVASSNFYGRKSETPLRNAPLCWSASKRTERLLKEVVGVNDTRSGSATKPCARGKRSLFSSNTIGNSRKRSNGFTALDVANMIILDHFDGGEVLEPECKATRAALELPAVDSSDERDVATNANSCVSKSRTDCARSTDPPSLQRDAETKEAKPIKGFVARKKISSCGTTNLLSFRRLPKNAINATENLQSRNKVQPNRAAHRSALKFGNRRIDRGTNAKNSSGDAKVSAHVQAKVPRLIRTNRPGRFDSEKATTRLLHLGKRKRRTSAPVKSAKRRLDFSFETDVVDETIGFVTAVETPHATRMPPKKRDAARVNATCSAELNGTNLAARQFMGTSGSRVEQTFCIEKVSKTDEEVDTTVNELLRGYLDADDDDHISESDCSGDEMSVDLNLSPTYLPNFQAFDYDPEHSYSLSRCCSPSCGTEGPDVQDVNKLSPDDALSTESGAVDLSPEPRVLDLSPEFGVVDLPKSPEKPVLEVSPKRDPRGSPYVLLKRLLLDANKSHPCIPLPATPTFSAIPPPTTPSTDPQAPRKVAPKRRLLRRSLRQVQLTNRSPS